MVNFVIYHSPFTIYHLPFLMYSQQEIEKAKKRVKSKKDFFQHLTAYVIVNFFLFALNMITSPFTWWFHFVTLSWGIGLVFHYVEVFGIPGFNVLSKDWEEKELESELRKLKDAEFRHKPEAKSPPEPAESLKLKELRKNYDETDFV